MSGIIGFLLGAVFGFVVFAIVVFLAIANDKNEYSLYMFNEKCEFLLLSKHTSILFQLGRQHEYVFSN